MTAINLKRLAATVLALSIAAMAVTHAAAFLMHQFEWYNSVLFFVLYLAANGAVLVAALSFALFMYILVSSAISRRQRSREEGT
jgi:NO-binding membrane sensor protein with MHYT domain